MAIFAVFGTPTPMFYWGINLLRALLHAGGVTYDFMSASTTEEFSDLWQDRQNENVLFVSDSPDARLGGIFVDKQAYCVVFLDQPADGVAFLRKKQNVSFYQALRTESLCLSTLGHFVTARNALIIRSDEVHSTRATLQAIAAHFKMQSGAEVIDNALAYMTGDASPDASCLDQLQRHVAGFDEVRREGLTPEQLELANQSLWPIYSGAMGPLHWDSTLFFNCSNMGDPLNEQLLGKSEMTGPARFVAYGPYMHLPSGDWSVDVGFTVEQNHSGNKLQIDIICGDYYRLVQSALPAHGAFSVNLPLKVAESRLPVEIRFRLSEGAIEGVFDLVGAKFRYNG